MNYFMHCIILATPPPPNHVHAYLLTFFLIIIRVWVDTTWALVFACKIILLHVLLLLTSYNLLKRFKQNIQAVRSAYLILVWVECCIALYCTHTKMRCEKMLPNYFCFPLFQALPDFVEHFSDNMSSVLACIFEK